VPLFPFTYLRYFHLAYFSKPVGDRTIYRAAHRARARRILEIGIGSAGRTSRLVRLALRGAGGEVVRYAAVDLFEARPADKSPGISLKQTHQLLATTGAQVRLIPGDPAHALARAANSLQNMDLLVISADYDVATLGGTWFYVPRMLHARSRVYLETRSPERSGTSFRLMPLAEIEALAKSARRRAA
jgi:hypothetical protein